MRKLFTGAATALVTPFNNDKVDYRAFCNLINRQINSKIDALVILGTTGEISTLSAKEREKIIEFSLSAVQNRVPVIFGIGGNDPKSIIRLGKFVRGVKMRNHYRHVGIMITAPYYNKTTQDGLYEFYKTITAAVKLPTVVYNVPGRTGINIEPLTMQRISRLPFIAGIKEASGNIYQIAEIARLCPDTAVYCGDDTLCLPSYAVGCAGIISAASNIDAISVKEIYRKRSLELFQKHLPLYKSLFVQVNPILVKYELAKLGLIKNELRLPLVPYTEKS